MIIKNGMVYRRLLLPHIDDGTETFFVFSPSRGDIVGIEAQAGISTRLPGRAEWEDVVLPPNVVHVHRSPSSTASFVTLIARGEPQELLKLVASSEERFARYKVFKAPGSAAPQPEGLDLPEPALPRRRRADSIEVLVQRSLRAVVSTPVSSTFAPAPILGGPGDVCLSDPAAALTTTVTDADVTDEFLDADAYYEALWDELDAKTDPIGVAQKFFADLDSETHYRLFHHRVLCVDPDDCYEYDYRKNAIDYVASKLLERLTERAKTYTADPELTGAGAYTPSTSVSAGYLDYVAELFQSVVEKHYGAGAAFDKAAFDQAFERFACGELRIEVTAKDTTAWACQPSTGFYFLFAELAFARLDVNANEEPWKSALAVLVRTQPMFCTVYAPDPIPPNAQLQHYNACNFDALVQMLWKKFGKREFRKLYDPLLATLDDCHTMAAFHTTWNFPGL